MMRNHDFKMNFDSMGNDIKPVHDAQNLCLYWLDGRRMMFKYAYFMSAKLDIDNHKGNCLNLFFTSHTISLYGDNLSILFEHFNNGRPNKIRQENNRYHPLNDPQKYTILDIIVE